MTYPLILLAQLDDFCSGDKGDPIFLETFGDQSTAANSNAIGTTTYTYRDNRTPEDGEYTISSTFNWFSSWFNTLDHTEGDVRGKALIVNADDNTAGQFFERGISGLCEGTTYEFSTWLLNVSSLSLSSFCTSATGIPGGIPINVRFEIWDETDTILLGSGDTGDIFSPQKPIWQQYGITFQTQSGQNGVVLRILNNGIGGCGNDLALDDITFASCGDGTILDTSLNRGSPAQFCNSFPGSVELTITPDFSVFSTHFYQWQTSSDGMNFIDIVGATNQTYRTPNLSTEGDYYYRVKIAETLVNLANDFCNSASDNYLIQIRDKEVMPTLNSQTTFCEGDEVFITVNSNPGLLVRWYNSNTSSTILSEGNTYNLGQLTSGDYSFFAETYETDLDCPSDRLLVEIEVFGAVVSSSPLTFESICPNEEITIESSLENSTYMWNTGETTRSINISQTGEYTVNIMNVNGCPGVEKFIVSEKAKPAIVKEIQSNEDKITVVSEFIGDYEYSLDGINYQSSPVFTNNDTNRYTAYIRDISICNSQDQRSFFHLNIPKAFTPNADGIKDEFVINSIKRVEIYNRYGKLIKQGLGNFIWDGTRDGKILPSDSYWYLLETNEGLTFKGSILLKR